MQTAPIGSQRPVDPRLAEVQPRLDEVMTALARATGGAPLCRVDLGSVKKQEGRVAALSEVRRLLRRHPGAPLDPLLERWRADLASRRERGASAGWLEYLAGGVDELQRLAAGPEGPASEQGER